MWLILFVDCSLWAFTILLSGGHSSSHKDPRCPCPRSGFGRSCLHLQLQSSGSQRYWGMSWDTVGMLSDQIPQSHQHHTLWSSDTEKRNISHYILFLLVTQNITQSKQLAELTLTFFDSQHTLPTMRLWLQPTCKEGWNCIYNVPSLHSLFTKTRGIKSIISNILLKIICWFYSFGDIFRITDQ